MSVRRTTGEPATMDPPVSSSGGRPARQLPSGGTTVTHEVLARRTADFRAYCKPRWWQIRKRWRWRRWQPLEALIGAHEPIRRFGVRVD